MKQWYDIKDLRGDIFGGLTAGIVALPLALAFGVQSGLGAIAGLYGAIVLGMLAAILGGTNTQVSGPTGPMTVISAAIIADAIHLTGSLEAAFSVIIASFCLAGVFQVGLGVFRTGHYVRYMPYPVLSGFMSGIGVIIILYQIYPLMGHTSAKDTVQVFLNIATPLSALNMQALLLGLLTIAIIYIFPKFTKAVPSQLVALVVVSLFAYFMHASVPLIANIPEGLPSLRINEIFRLEPRYLWTVIEFAAMLAALGTIDSLLTSVIADNLTRTKHDSNKELIGQGIGNMCSAMIGGLPGAGATMRTVVNINAGGKTKLSGFIHGLLLLAVLLGMGHFVKFIPLSVLAGILITVGLSIIDYRGLSHIRVIPRTDAVILIIVLSITVFGNLLHAVAVGVVMACVLFMKEASDLAESQTTIKALKEHYKDNVKQEILTGYNAYKDIIYIKRIVGPLFFGFSARFQELIQDIRDDLAALIIRMDKMPYMDQTGQEAMKEVVTELVEHHVIVIFVGLQPQPLGMLRKTGVIPELVPESHIFTNFEEVESWLEAHLLKGEGAFEKLTAELYEKNSK